MEEAAARRASAGGAERGGAEGRRSCVELYPAEMCGTAPVLLFDREMKVNTQHGVADQSIKNGIGVLLLRGAQPEPEAFYAWCKAHPVVSRYVNRVYWLDCDEGAALEGGQCR